MSKELPELGPIDRLPAIEAIVTEAYASLRAFSGPRPFSNVWMIIRAALQVARDKDKPKEAELRQALAATLGEMIAELSPAQQQVVVQDTIHHVFAYAEMLRTPGFDQPHGVSGHG
jgi:hypothetical protein